MRMQGWRCGTGIPILPEGCECSLGVPTRTGGVEVQDGDPKQRWRCRAGIQRGAACGELACRWIDGWMDGRMPGVVRRGLSLCLSAVALAASYRRQSRKPPGAPQPCTPAPPPLSAPASEEPNSNQLRG